jgi:hypothetical protein
MLRVIVASCARDALVACNVSCESPTGVSEEDATVNVWEEFAKTVIGDAGMVLVPAGKPDIDIETDSLNPFDPTVATINGTLVLPCTMLTEVEEKGDVTDTEKSGAGGGGVDTMLPAPPPQAVIRNIKSVEIRHARVRWDFTMESSRMVNASPGAQSVRK